MVGKKSPLLCYPGPSQISTLLAVAFPNPALGTSPVRHAGHCCSGSARTRVTASTALPRKVFRNAAVCIIKVKHTGYETPFPSEHPFCNYRGLCPRGACLWVLCNGSQLHTQAAAAPSSPRHTSPVTIATRPGLPNPSFVELVTSKLVSSSTWGVPLIGLPVVCPSWGIPSHLCCQMNADKELLISLAQKCSQGTLCIPLIFLYTFALCENLLL